jgi:glycosyltransferase involved in cell wall biosynthesis
VSTAFSGSSRLHLVLPGDPETRTGGYIYDRRILQGLGRLGWETHLHRLDDCFPEPTPAALERARAVLARIPSGDPVVIDGLAMGAMPRVTDAECRRLRIIALIHHPLAEEAGLSPRRRQALRSSERRALAGACGVVVTSRYTAGLVAELGVPPARIRVVEPGTDPAPLSRGSGGKGLQMLCVATLVRRKGHDLLFQALAGLVAREWRLVCVGSRERSPETAADLRRRLDQLRLEGRVELAGEVSPQRLADLYESSDLFVLATRFEGFGMALTEALARGLPVVSTRAGAVPGTVPEGAGLLVPPEDPGALAAALVRVMDGPDLLRRLSAGARTARAHLPTWEAACARMDRVLRDWAG